MLNLPIAMFPINEARLILLLISLLAFSPGNIFASMMRPYGLLAAQKTPEIVQSPKGGEALQGVVSIIGTTDLEGFRSAEVAFAYQNDATSTWFVIQQISQPVKEGSLASWDTTTIADGIYRLRVQVFLQDGQVQETVVNGLRVRNYTPVETGTPDTGAARFETSVPTSTPLPDFQVTPGSVKPAPTNPVQLTGADIQSSALRGVFAILIALIIAGMYVGLRVLKRR